MKISLMKLPILTLFIATYFVVKSSPAALPPPYENFTDHRDYQHCLLDYLNKIGIISYVAAHDDSEYPSCALFHSDLNITMSIMYRVLEINLENALNSESETECLIEVFKHMKFLEYNVIATTAMQLEANYEKLEMIFKTSKGIFVFATVRCLITAKMLAEIFADFSEKMTLTQVEYECIRDDVFERKLLDRVFIADYEEFFSEKFNETVLKFEPEEFSVNGKSKRERFESESLDYDTPEQHSKDEVKSATDLIEKSTDSYWKGSNDGVNSVLTSLSPFGRASTHEYQKNNDYDEETTYSLLKPFKLAENLQKSVDNSTNLDDHTKNEIKIEDEVRKTPTNAEIDHPKVVDYDFPDLVSTIKVLHSISPKEESHVSPTPRMPSDLTTQSPLVNEIIGKSNEYESASNSEETVDDDDKHSKTSETQKRNATKDLNGKKSEEIVESSASERNEVENNKNSKESDVEPARDNSSDKSHPTTVKPSKESIDEGQSEEANVQAIEVSPTSIDENKIIPSKLKNVFNSMKKIQAATTTTLKPEIITTIFHTTTSKMKLDQVTSPLKASVEVLDQMTERPQELITASLNDLIEENISTTTLGQSVGHLNLNEASVTENYEATTNNLKESSHKDEKEIFSETPMVETEIETNNNQSEDLNTKNRKISEEKEEEIVETSYQKSTTGFGENSTIEGFVVPTTLASDLTSPMTANKENFENLKAENLEKVMIEKEITENSSQKDEESLQEGIFEKTTIANIRSSSEDNIRKSEEKIKNSEEKQASLIDYDENSAEVQEIQANVNEVPNKSYKHSNESSETKVHENNAKVQEIADHSPKQSTDIDFDANAMETPDFSTQLPKINPQTTSDARTQLINPSDMPSKIQRLATSLDKLSKPPQPDHFLPISDSNIKKRDLSKKSTDCPSILTSVASRVRHYKIESLDADDNECMSEKVSREDVDDILAFTVMKRMAQSDAQKDLRNRKLMSLVMSFVTKYVDCTDLYGLVDMVKLTDD